MCTSGLVEKYCIVESKRNLNLIKMGCMVGLWSACVGQTKTNPGVPDYWDAHSSIHWQTNNRMKVSGILNVIQYYANEEEDFDIYQICAFDSLNCSRKTYFMSAFKAVCCLIMQAPTLIYIVYQLINQSDKSYCNVDINAYDDITVDFIANKLFAFFYSFFFKFLHF